MKHGDFIAASGYLTQAVEANRLIRDRDRAAELHSALLHCQKHADEQMRSFSQPLDFLEPLEEEAKKRVRGKTLYQAILSLAYTAPLHNLEKLSRSAEERSDDQRFIDLFAMTELVDHRHRVIARKPSFLSSNPFEVDGAKRAEMDEVGSLYRHVFVHGFVEPARQLIVLEHPISPRTFVPLVVDNPFVPRGREVIFARGLFSGMVGDVVNAAHMLIPQMEHSLRCLHAEFEATTTGTATVVIDNDLDLNKMLGMHLAVSEEILGTDVAFDLRGLLVGRFGNNLRNRLAHGQMDRNAFDTTPIVYLWWLCLQLCYAPIIRRFVGRKEKPIE